MIDKKAQGKKITKKQLQANERKEDRKKLRQWSIDVRARDGNKCAVCGTDKFLQAHHLIPKEIRESRFEIDNGIALCPSHHKYSLEISAHRNPLAFARWFEVNNHDQWWKVMDFLGHVEHIGV